MSPLSLSALFEVESPLPYPPGDEQPMPEDLSNYETDVSDDEDTDLPTFTVTDPLAGRPPVARPLISAIDPFILRDPIVGELHRMSNATEHQTRFRGGYYTLVPLDAPRNRPITDREFIEMERNRPALDTPIRTDLIVFDFRVHEVPSSTLRAALFPQVMETVRNELLRIGFTGMVEFRYCFSHVARIRVHPRRRCVSVWDRRPAIPRTTRHHTPRR